MRLFNQAGVPSSNSVNILEDDGDDIPESKYIFADIEIDENSEGESPEEDIGTPLHVIDNEIEKLSTQLNNFTYSRKIILENTITQFEPRTTPVDQERLIYDLSTRKLYNDLELVIGDNKIPRFSCACHKLNITIQNAIENQHHLKDAINKLSSFASSCRNSISLSTVFTDLKCRPKIENKTRWFSQLYVLFWAQKAYQRNG